MTTPVQVAAGGGATGNSPIHPSTTPSPVGQIATNDDPRSSPLSNSYNSQAPSSVHSFNGLETTERAQRVSKAALRPPVKEELKDPVVQARVEYLLSPEYQSELARRSLCPPPSYTAPEVPFDRLDPLTVFLLSKSYHVKAVKICNRREREGFVIHRDKTLENHETFILTHALFVAAVKSQEEKKQRVDALQRLNDASNNRLLARQPCVDRGSVPHLYETWQTLLREYWLKLEGADPQTTPANLNLKSTLIENWKQVIPTKSQESERRIYPIGPEETCTMDRQGQVYYHLRDRPPEHWPGMSAQIK